MAVVKVKREWNFLGAHDICKSFDMLNDLDGGIQDTTMSTFDTIRRYLEHKYPNNVFLFTEHGEHFVISEIYTKDDEDRKKIRKILDAA